MARARQPQARTRASQPSGRRRAATSATASESAIFAWEDDPGEPPPSRMPIGRPVPNLAQGSLPVSIDGPAPPVAQHPIGTPEFRYWATADALARAAGFWNGLLGGTKWEPTNGAVLRIGLDDGVQFNAFYNRHGLHFFHGTSKGTTVFSAESPDVCCHELGHAVLDALRPELWDALAGEVAAFHESFGDMSAMLSALQLRPFATRLLAETRSLSCTSRLSRLAEQLGWAIRQCRPDAVEPDCLRNAANSFFYEPPETLPPRAPSAQLSSEPHSLSRVFTAAFLEILAGIFRLQATHDEAGLAATAQDAGTLLVEGVKASPVVPTYFSQVALHMVTIDASRNRGKYFDVLADAFVGHGILSVDAEAATPAADAPAARRALAEVAPRAEEAPLATVAVPAARIGLAEDLTITTASQPKRFAVAGAAPDIGSVKPVEQDRAAISFLEDLVRRGRIDFGGHETPRAAVVASDRRKTHVVVRERQKLVLRRQFFDCGFDCCEG
jgi:hypothetical protein